MKVYGWRHKRIEAYFTIFHVSKESADAILLNWLEKCHKKWADRFDNFEEIEANIEYTTGDST